MFVLVPCSFRCFPFDCRLRLLLVLASVLASVPASVPDGGGAPAPGVFLPPEGYLNFHRVPVRPLTPPPSPAPRAHPKRAKICMPPCMRPKSKLQRTKRSACRRAGARPSTKPFDPRCPIRQLQQIDKYIETSAGKGNKDLHHNTLNVNRAKMLQRSRTSKI